MVENTVSTIHLKLAEMATKRNDTSDSVSTCPMCQTPVKLGQVICTQCGMNFSTGDVLDTATGNMPSAKHSRWLPGGIIILIVLAVMFAWQTTDRPSSEMLPRPIAEIRRDILWQPALYQAPKSGKLIRAPRSAGVVFDKATGEICWPILVCVNPRCPGRQANKPFRFIAPDPDIAANANGGLEINESTEFKNELDNCPKCLAKRDLEGEFDVDRDKYANWVRLYELPETAKSLSKLYAERRSRIQYNLKNP